MRAKGLSHARDTDAERPRRRTTPVLAFAGAAPDPMQILLDGLPWMICRKDESGRVGFCNRALSECWARSNDGTPHIPEMPISDAAYDDFWADDKRALRGGEAFEVDYPQVEGDGVLRILRIPLHGPGGEGLGFWAIGWELSAPQRRREETEEQLHLFKMLMDNITDCIYFKDRDSRFKWINRHMLAKFGVGTLAEISGKTDFDVFTVEHAGQAFRDEQEIIRTGRPLVNVEEKETLPGGEIRWASTTKMALRDARGNIVGTFGISRDITQRRETEEQLVRQVFYDGLTRLPNRALFMDRLEHLLDRAARQSRRKFVFAVLHLDVDRFKGVNDSLGHQAGDALVVQIAQRLETCLRPGDTLARLGGDEFAALLEDITSEGDAIRVAERIHRAVAAPFNLAGVDVYVSVSLGIALSTSGYTRSEDMLRDADTAMYRAKSKGRSRHEVFDAAMHHKAVALLELETDLRRALERKECHVHYQPIVELKSQRIVGFEALVRWIHPKRGMVLPDQFIPLAEETGLLGAIGSWVLRESCQQMSAWQRLYPHNPPLGISVNLSTRQLVESDLCERIAATLQETGLAPENLSLEITESTLMHDPQACTATLKRLRGMGIRISIDDFGTGYSSLSYLQSFPVDTLKIDRSFIKQMDNPGGSYEIVRAIVALAQNLGLSTTAEGVETAEQAAALRALGCRNVQGFFFSRPRSSEDAEKLLRDGLFLPQGVL